MNAAANHDEVEENPTPEGPGRRLKALRESQELDIGRVAALLHLSTDKLEALEADDYQRLPGSVFTQGYIRNYARLLGVPVEPFLKAYHQTGVDQAVPPALKISQVRHEVRSSHLLVRLMTWIIVIGLVALVVVWWRGYLQWPPADLGGFGAPDRAPESVADDGLDEGGMPDLMPGSETPVTEIDGGGEASLLLPEGPAAEEAGPEPEAVVTEITPEVTPAAAPPTPTPAVTPETAAPTAAPAGPAAPEPAEATAAATGRVLLRFNDVSWTQVRDADGRLLFRGEMKGGSQRALEGTPPFNLVVGNASQVRVTIDGRPFDITPYIRGNVARFTLDPSSTSGR